MMKAKTKKISYFSAIVISAVLSVTIMSSCRVTTPIVNPEESVQKEARERDEKNVSSDDTAKENRKSEVETPGKEEAGSVADRKSVV